MTSIVLEQAEERLARGFARQSSLCSKKQNRNANTVLDSTRCRPKEYVGEKTVPMRAHCNEIASFFPDPANNFLSGVAVRELGLRGDARCLEFFPNFCEISGIFSNLRAHRIRAVGSGCPPIGHVEQHNPAAGESRKFLDVFNDGSVRQRTFHRHKDRLVHGLFHSVDGVSCR